MSSYRTLATSLIGAAAICTTSIVTAGAAHAAPSEQTCRLTPSSWVHGTNIYTGSSNTRTGSSTTRGDAGAGLQTRLVITDMSLTGILANWIFDPVEAAGSTVYDAATLDRQDDGTYVAHTTGRTPTIIGPEETATTFTIRPYCVTDPTGSWTVGSIYVTIQGGLRDLDATLKPDTESGNENQGKPNS